MKWFWFRRWVLRQMYPSGPKRELLDELWEAEKYYKASKPPVVTPK